MVVIVIGCDDTQVLLLSCHEQVPGHVGMPPQLLGIHTCRWSQWVCICLFIVDDHAIDVASSGDYVHTGGSHALVIMSLYGEHE